MATWSYTARKRGGEKIEGTVEAADRRAAMVQIEQLGCVPISVREGSGQAKAK
jgi:type II secretory pathway component PulF